MVRHMYLEWLRWMVQEFEIDGFRVIAANHVGMDMHKDMKKLGIFTLGEFYNTFGIDQWLLPTARPMAVSVKDEDVVALSGGTASAYLPSAAASPPVLGGALSKERQGPAPPAASYSNSPASPPIGVNTSAAAALQAASKSTAESQKASNSSSRASGKGNSSSSAATSHSSSKPAGAVAKALKAALQSSGPETASLKLPTSGLGGARKLAASSGALGFNGWNFAGMADEAGGSQAAAPSVDLLYSSNKQGHDMAALATEPSLRKAVDSSNKIVSAAGLAPIYASGAPYESTSLGVPAFNITQEYLYLYAKLSSGGWQSA